jgi:hypothetical protein
MEPKWHIAFCNVTITGYTGVTYSDYYGSPAVMLEAQLKASEIAEKRFGVGKFIHPYVDSPSCTFSSFLGMPIIVPEEDELPYIDSSKPLIGSPDNIGQLVVRNPKTSGLMAKRWETWQYYISMGYKVRFGGYEGSIISTACEISNSNVLAWLIEEPALAKDLLNFVVDAERAIEDLDSALCGKSLNGYTGDDFSGLLSPRLYKEFAVPCYQKIYSGKTSRFMHSELLRAEHLRIAKDLLQITSFHGAGAKNLTNAEIYSIMGSNFWVQLTPQEMRELTPYEINERIKDFANCGAEYVQLYPGRDTTDRNMEAAITAVQRECKGGPIVEDIAYLQTQKS